MPVNPAVVDLEILAKRLRAGVVTLVGVAGFLVLSLGAFLLFRPRIPELAAITLPSTLAGTPFAGTARYQVALIVGGAVAAYLASR